jgi:hypothetical protein
MAQRGRPRKKPVAQRIEQALGEVNTEFDNEPRAQEITEVVVSSTGKVTERIPGTADKKDLKDDYDFARGNLHNLLQKGNKILDGIIDLAEGSESPRTYEVAGTLLKTLLEGTRELMTLQKDVQDVERKSADLESEKVAPVNIKSADTVNNIVCTTKEMLRIMNQAEEERE